MRAALMLLAALLNAAIGPVASMSPRITALGGVAFSGLAIVVLLLEFVCGFEFIDPFFKKAQSVNIVGSLRRPGATNVRLLIVIGHDDSSCPLPSSASSLRTRQNGGLVPARSITCRPAKPALLR